MNIKRTALTELLPNAKEGFHTAILTTYSFDFYFFEMVLLRRLRSIGIRNVLVLADATMLHEATQFSSGFGAKRTKTYNLIPVQSEGAFHPKLLFLAGEKSGWMAVGSGNLTESGHGKNDEVWGAFYYAPSNCIFHENLFVGAWNYIKMLEEKHLQGFAKAQIEAISKIAQWLGDLPQASAGQWSQINEGFKTMLIHDAGTSSIWEQLIANLPESGVERVTVFSPFFDTNGVLLQQLANHFPSAAFRVIVEPDWNLLPFGMDGAILDRMQFYNWKKLTGVSPEAKHQWLHGKIYIFESQAEGSFCFFGSSNASAAGFGLLTPNCEMNLMLHSENLDFMEVLGVEIKAEAKEDFEALISNKGTTVLPSIYKIAFATHVLTVELEGQYLSIWLSKPLQKPCRVVLFDGEGNMLQSSEAPLGKTEIRFRYTGKQPPFACQILSTDAKSPLSNRQLVAHLADLNRAILNPADAKMELLLDRLRDGENGAITEILPLLDLEKPEVSEHIRERGFRASSEVFEDGEGYLDDIELPESEFTKIPEDRIYAQHYQHFDPANDLSEFLLQLSLNSVSNLSETDSDDDEELLDAETGERKDGASISSKQPPSSDTIDIEAAAAKKFLVRYRKALEHATGTYLDAVRRNTQPIPLTNRDLSHFLIALRLMVRYGDRISVNSKSTMAVLPFRQWTLSAWKPAKIESVQMACYEIIGKLLLLLYAGIQPSQTRQENNRSNVLREAIFFDLLYLYANALPEKGKDEVYIPLFYHNLFHHFQDFLPIAQEKLMIELQRRGELGAGISPAMLAKTIQRYQIYESFFSNRLKGKDLTSGLLIKHENQGFLVLDKKYGVGFKPNKNAPLRRHPGGKYEKENFYWL